MFNQFQPNVENMQQYLNQENEKSFGDGPNWWSLPSGMSSVRILPPWDPTGRVALPVFMHPIEFQGQGMKYKKWNWTCVNKTFNKPCPICEGLSGIAAAGVDISNWEANRRQFYFNAIVMHDPSKESPVAPGTHVLLKAPKTFYDWVISQITNPMIGDITNVQTGIDIYVTKEGQGLGTTYNMTLSPNGRTPIPQEYLDKITDLYNLDDIFSAGFDQAQIDELVGHLRQSAGVMNNMVGNTVAQMQAPTPQVQQTPTYPQGGLNYGQPVGQSISQVPQQTVQSTSTPQQNSIPTTGPIGNPAPTPFSAQAPTQPTPAPVQPAVAPVAQEPQTAPATNLPNCYGKYDAGNVSCVVCPHEIQCSQSN